MSRFDFLEDFLARLVRRVASVSSILGMPRIFSFARRVYWRSRLGGIGRGSRIYPRVVIHSPLKVVLGDHVSVAEFVHIWGGGGVTIGNDVMIASHCVITSQTHNVNPAQRHEDVEQPVAIGNNVWIGSGATILPGVRIGENSVIAAGSVVTQDVPRNSIAMGVPARICKTI